MTEVKLLEFDLGFLENQIFLYLTLSEMTTHIQP